MLKKRMGYTIAMTVGFTLAVILLIRSGSPWWMVGLMGAVGIGLVVLTGRRGRHTPWAEASGLVSPELAIVFWKPGCMFCERLLRAVGKDERVTWVNVWADEDANAEVRRLNDGDELTPTARVGERVLRNPSAEELLGSLAG